MQANFFCKTGALAGANYEIGEHATIGRGQDNTVVLTDDVVSTSHARIAFDSAAAGYYLEDLGSTNGTRLDGVPVSGRQRLGDLHVVTFGEQHDFIFVIPPDEGRQRESAERLEQRRQEPVAQPVEPATRYEPPPRLTCRRWAHNRNPGRTSPRQPNRRGPRKTACPWTRLHRRRWSRPRGMSLPPRSMSRRSVFSRSRRRPPPPDRR
ncbi:MAG: FHA domain-containing protein [Acidobacteria bacterium]|nr:FHA domain-containing protein [Acidobacteriota bacterium]